MDIPDMLTKLRQVFNKQVMQMNTPFRVRVSWFRRALFSLTFLALVSSCLPKEVPLSTSLLDEKNATPAFAGFSGLVSATTVGASKVKLTWTLATDSRVVAYNIYDTTLYFSPKLIKTVPASQSEVTITSLNAMEYYSFRVRAATKDLKEDGNTVDLGAIPYAGIKEIIVQSSSTALVKFTEGSNADGINIYCKSTASPSEVLMSEITDVLKTEVMLTGLEPGMPYTCRAALVISSFVDNNNITIDFIPMGTASILEFVTQPNSAKAGIALTAQPVVRIMDDRGNVVSAGPDSTAIVTLVISANSPTLGTVRGTSSVTAVKGIATFSEISFQEAGVKILRAIKSDTSAEINGSTTINADSNQFTITPGAVSPQNSKISISPEVPPNPALIANGSDSYQVNVELKDEFGNAVSGTVPIFTSSITGDTLTQPIAPTDGDGKASGSISSTIADSSPPYRSLSISSPAGLTSVKVDVPFSPGAASKLGFVQQPVNSPAGAGGLNQVKVGVLDAQGNVVVTGPASASDITLSIASNLNGATLMGTTTVTAVNGIATFVGLGIDKTQTGYKLLASSGSYTPAYSNSFNVTAGTPQKIRISGVTDVLSGICSGAITVQLQDLGNNPTNALQNTPVQITGLGSAQMFSSSTCGGTALSSTLTFTAGTNTKTIYIKDPKAEQLSIVGNDASAVMLSGNHTVKVSPNKIGLLAQSTLGGPFKVVAGECSTEIVVTAMGDNGLAGPIFNPTTITFTGIAGTQGKLYSDSSCAVEVNPAAVVLQPTIGTNYTTKFYFKDNKAEVLSVTLVDPNGVIGTISTLQTLIVLPSAIDFTGPTNVVAGACSSAFTVALKDAQGNAVVAQDDTNLTINGLAGTTTGKFYYSAGCSGTALTTSLTIMEGSSQAQIYFKDVAAELLTVHISDPGVLMSNSPSIQISVSPSALRLTTPAPASALTTVCAGPFVIETLDGLSLVTGAIVPITANLSGAGSSGKFFSDSGCTTTVNQFVFGVGQSTKQFYFKGQYPETALNITVTDAAGVLTSSSRSWAVLPARAWIGTGATNKDSNGNLLWFENDVVPVSARQDSANYPYSVKFSPDNRYLYVAEWQNHQVLKYDYQNQTYVGWIGRLWRGGGVGTTGSSLATPSSAACVATANYGVVPGWCLGGQGAADGNTANGAFYHPADVLDDGTYLYVSNYHSHTVNRYNSATGAFEGWIGRTGTASPTGSGTGGPSTCSSTPTNTTTPGWCRGGNPSARAQDDTSGGMRYPRALATDGTFLFVGNEGAIQRYLLSDGSYQGWVGMVKTTPTGGEPGCSATAANNRTPGWCQGGLYRYSNPTDFGGGGVSYPGGMKVVGTTLYVNQGGTGYIDQYDTTTGAWLGRLPGLSFNWSGPAQFDFDGTNFLFTDNTRVIRTDTTGLVTGWMGKVSNNSSMSGNPGCDSLVPNENTPGWCLGGGHKAGMDGGSFNNLLGLAYDGNGSFVVVQAQYPGIKKYNASTGAYQGMLAFRSKSPSEWSNDAVSFAQAEGFDDKSMYNPRQIYAHGDYLYVVEYGASRVKKIHKLTGETIGWIGGITSKPTGGLPGCTSANAMSAAPFWCLGSLFNPTYIWNWAINASMDGIMYTPSGITGDGTYIYVTDINYHRVQKFNMETGAYVGWIGRISGSPIGGAPGCVGALTGTFTPGWCTGGTPQAGSSDGHFRQPTAITYVNGNLYVIDSGNHRVTSYDAASGAFRGWIGRISTNPTSGCSYGSNGSFNVSQSGWCFGGTSTASGAGTRPGGFHFWDSGLGGIYSDGVHLYITNFYNQRIDKWTLTGEFVSSMRTRQDIYTGVWETDGSIITGWSSGCSAPVGIWGDANALYVTIYHACGGDNAGIVMKSNKTTGTVVGWQGAIRSDATPPPTGGDPGCAGATLATPGWCQGGAGTIGYRLGQFSSVELSIAGDDYFLYISDNGSHRVTRIPK